MSYLTWHTPTASAVLDGPEVHYAHHMVRKLATGFLPFSLIGDDDRLRRLLPEGHYLNTSYAQHPAVFTDGYRTAFAGGMGLDALMVWRGHVIDLFELQLNTVMQVGSDPMRFLARMAGQCELHLTIPGEHRAWVADLIEQGLADGLLRTGMGWDAPVSHRRSRRYGGRSVLSLLRERVDEPVVLSYSVTDAWPNPEVGDWMPPWPEGVERDWRLLTEAQQTERGDRAEAWYELTTEQQWQHCLTALDTLPQLTPDRLGARFGHGLSVLDLAAPDLERRLDAALGTKASS